MGVHDHTWQVLALAALCAAAASAAAVPSADRAGAGPGHSMLGSSLGPIFPLVVKSSRCGPGRYWNAAQQKCFECTQCAGRGREMTLRPCDGLRDTQCAPLSDLRIDWDWHRTDRPGKHNAAPGAHERINSLSKAEARLLLPQRRDEKVIDFGDDYILPEHPRQPQHQQEKMKHKKTKKSHHVKAKGNLYGDDDDFADYGASGDAAVDSDDEDLARTSWRRVHRPRPAAKPTTTSTTTTTTTTARPTTTPASLVEDFIVVKEDRSEEDMLAEMEASLEQRSRSDDADVVATTQTFTTAETLVWDWQAGVLVAAVCACLLFFIVAAAYSCQHAWHFKKLKKHLDADMEEISARLALMSGMGSEHLHDSKAPTGTGAANEKSAFPVRRGDHLRTGRQQNDYCLATLPRKTRV